MAMITIAITPAFVGIINKSDLLIIAYQDLVNNAG